MTNEHDFRNTSHSKSIADQTTSHQTEQQQTQQAHHTTQLNFSEMFPLIM